MTDKNVTAVCEALQSRAEAGLLKYGCTTERTDLSYADWLLHLRNELLDAAVYTQKLISQEPKSTDPGTLKTGEWYEFRYHGAEGWIGPVQCLKDQPKRTDVGEYRRCNPPGKE